MLHCQELKYCLTQRMYLPRKNNVKLMLFNPFSAGTVFRRQILTSKDGPRTKIIKQIIMAVDP